MDRNPPILNHNSRGRSTSSCNCGRKQAPREDPFDIQAANYDFYQVWNHTPTLLHGSDSANLTHHTQSVLISGAAAFLRDHLSIRGPITVFVFNEGVCGGGIYFSIKRQGLFISYLIPPEKLKARPQHYKHNRRIISWSHSFIHSNFSSTLPVMAVLSLFPDVVVVFSAFSVPCVL